MNKFKKTIESTLIDPQTAWTLGVFVLITLVSFFFKTEASDPTLNIAMLYTLGIVIITGYTEGYFYGFVFTFASVISVNYFFTFPFDSFRFYGDGYSVTFVGMITIGILTSALSTHLKEQSERLILQEKDIAKHQKQLLEAEKEKERANLLRAISHDLRTPLTGIIGNSQSILNMENTLSNEEKRQLVERINEDGQWLINMVENLLSITKFDGEHTRVKMTSEPIDEVISAAVITFKKRYPQVDIRVKVPDDFIMVKVDAILIQQVILNILQNALVHGKGEKRLDIYVEDKNPDIVIRIRDYGIGIDEKKIKKVFSGGQYRYDSKEADSKKGMGIGLSICKTIVKAHGGVIHGFNHGNGAEFSFTLPQDLES